jgi:hypothetical protein
LLVNLILILTGNLLGRITKYTFFQWKTATAFSKYKYSTAEFSILRVCFSTLLCLCLSKQQCLIKKNINFYSWVSPNYVFETHGNQKQVLPPSRGCSMLHCSVNSAASLPTVRVNFNSLLLFT